MNRAPGFLRFTDGSHTGKTGHITRDNGSNYVWDHNYGLNVTRTEEEKLEKLAPSGKIHAKFDFC